jgi:hypothetical protein
LLATLSGFFGGLAALIATVGLYGVMSYSVARRRSEIGIRMVLGADRRDVVWMVMREAAALLGTGLTVGAVSALALGERAPVWPAAARSGNADGGRRIAGDHRGARELRARAAGVAARTDGGTAG